MIKNCVNHVTSFALSLTQYNQKQDNYSIKHRDKAAHRITIHQGRSCDCTNTDDQRAAAGNKFSMANLYVDSLLVLRLLDNINNYICATMKIL